MSHAGHAAVGWETQPLSESIVYNTPCYRRGSLGAHLKHKRRDELTLFYLRTDAGQHREGTVPHVLKSLVGVLAPYATS